MKKRKKFKLAEGESLIQQGKNELSITGSGHRTYLWIGGNGCYGTLSGMKTLETLAASIYIALGHSPSWLRPKRRKTKTKRQWKTTG